MEKYQKLSRTTTKPDEIAHSQLRADQAASKGMKRAIAPLIVLVVAAAVYGSIYFREESISTGIGANLVPSERVLEGEVPYRDFYKIQTPGILLLNAWLFKLRGTTLLTAFAGVLVFKVLTVVMVFIISRLVVSSLAAVVPTLLAFVWLPPGGPFRPAPIQYEMLFLLAAAYFTLLWLDSKKALHIFAAGLAVGLVAIFKQNVGVYAAIALGLSIIFNTRGLPRSFSEAKRLYLDSWKENARAHIAAVVGIGLPLAGLLIYLASNAALSAAMRVFVQGPGEHILMKFTGYPLPKYAAIVLICGLLALMASAYFSSRWPKLKNIINSLLFISAAICAIGVPRSAIDNSIYWFAPLLFLYAFWQYARTGRDKQAESRARGVLLILLLFAVASFGEVFPRSVRGLIIGTMPPAFILFAFLFSHNLSQNRITDFITQKAGIVLVSPPRRLAFAAISLVLMLFALKTILPHYFYFDASRTLRLKAETPLNFDRGRGIYLPDARAAEVDSMVYAIQSRVDESGYFFAHALDAASYYFLADRNSPTGATLWNDAGTNDAERARTVEALRAKEVRLVLTNEQALAGERYGPLLDYLKIDFHRAATVGETIFLERNY
jgi:hypothetical protein